MLTTEGRNHIRRYQAQYVPYIAQAIAFGIGDRVEDAADTALHLEIVRSAIDLITYDFVTNQLIFRAPVPEDFVGTISEVGLYSLEQNPSGEYVSRNITTFDSATEDWVDPSDSSAATFSSTATRVGSDSLLHTPAAGATMNDTLGGLILDFSGNSASDIFTFAFNIANANTQELNIKFMTDAANYYLFNIVTPAQTAGYKIVQMSKGSAETTGVPDWSNITEIQVTTISNATGASSVEFDAIRIEDADSTSLDYVLVARKVLSVPVVSTDGLAQDVEFALDVSL